VQDADNLVWKLDLVLRSLAPGYLLDSYDAERIPAADDNLLNTTRSTDFIAPKSTASRILRDSVLALAASEPFARRLVNSGRLSLAACYDGSPLNTPDGLAAGDCPTARPGAAALDAPLGDGWLLAALDRGFTGVWFCAEDEGSDALARLQAVSAHTPLPVKPLIVSDAMACARYGAAGAPACYLFRPDGHIAARWPYILPNAIEAALARAIGR
jgi:3-(3-hydroxy-phenyl)propionate hydroxylase